MLSLAMSVLGRVSGLPLLAVVSCLGVTRLLPLIHLSFLRETTYLDIRCPFRIQRRHLLQNSACHGLDRLRELKIRIIREYHTIEEFDRHLFELRGGSLPEFQ